MTLAKAGVGLIDCVHKTPEAQPSGYPYVAIPQMKGGRIQFADARRISESDYREWTKKAKPQKHDVVLSRRTNPGVIAIDSTGTEFALGQNLVLLRADGKRVLPQYLRWLCLSKEWWQQIEKYINVGAVFSSLRCADVPNFELPIPPKNEQEIIAATLASLDDKIELNRRMNETLVALAQAIFKDWFVDLGPTRRKSEGTTDPVAILGNLIPDPARASETAALFPATFSNNGLPEGWQNKGLDEVAEFLNGLALQKYPPTGKDDLAVIKIAELRSGISAKTDRANRSIADKYVINDGDFLFSWSGSLLAKFWTEGEGALNQHLFKVSSETHPRWFYSQWVLHHMPEFQTIAASKATTMGHIQRGHLSAARVIVPPQPTLHAMTAIVEPLIERIIHNDLESRTLAKTRDYLLPKLMSGEVRVRDAEKIAEGGVKTDAKQASSTSSVFGADLFGSPVLSPDQETERDAVIVASVVKAFRRGREVVGNVKIQKGTYFIRRRAGLPVSSFAKQAAGPYDAHLNHEGGKPEAISKNWILASTSAGGRKTYDGNVPGAKIKEIDALVERYSLKEAIDWVVQRFASKTRDELECLATVDVAMQTLRAQRISPTLQAVKADIASDPKWKPKLAKIHFSDTKIQQAIGLLEEWFGG